MHRSDGAPAPPGATSTLPESTPHAIVSCAGPECACAHVPPDGRRWCCEACRNRHRDRSARTPSKDTRSRPGRQRIPKHKERRVAGVDGEAVTYPDANEGRGTYVLLSAATDDG